MANANWGGGRRSARVALCALLLAGLTTACGDSDMLPRRDAGAAKPDSGMYDDDDVDANVDDDDDDVDGAAPVPDGGQPDAAQDDAAEPVEPKEDLDGLLWEPKFEPDYNNLVAQPWVELVTTRQAELVVVHPDSLVFPLADNPEVLQWEPGRVVVSGPSEGEGMNPLGFARRVSTVQVQGDYIVVATETVGLEDVVTGDMQHTFDFDKMHDVDLSKLDLQWASENLYLDVPVLSPDFEVAPDDEPMSDLGEDGEPVPGDPFLGKIVSAVKRGVSTVTKAVGSAAGAVAQAAGTAWRAVTPASFTGSVGISREIRASHSGELFRVNFKKAFGEGGRTPIELSLKGQADIKADVTFKPGVQVGMRIPNIGHNTTFATWMNVDSQYRSYVALGVDLAAEVASASNVSGPDLHKKLQEQGEFAADVLTQAREKFTGNPDMKPAGGWKKTIFISSPATQIIMAGPIPVVFTQTFQLDLECGFAAKAELKAQMEFERNTNIKFSMHYESGRVTGTKPVFENRKNRTVNVTGGGSVSVSCGLIPRVNVFVYDTAGIFAGVRGSLVTEAAYKSYCEPDPVISQPKADISLGLYGNIGVQIGGRLQAPGASFLGSSGAKAGTDIGPFELWNTQFPIYEHVWKLNKGLGYCTPTCQNLVRDGRETDLNCGGGSCSQCAENKQCVRNSDCARGYCSGGKCSNTDHCGDGVQDGDETGIDCGGKSCKPCRTGVACYLPRDCQSGFCSVKSGSGSALGYCVQNHCTDNVKDADETGIDCGGATCAKCAVGVRSSAPEGCVSGLSDGTFCVDRTCRDRIKQANESDIDCGGTSSCERCSYMQACESNRDCGHTAPVCDPSTKLCARPLCDDAQKNVDESDVDCGGSCAGCSEGLLCNQTSDCAQGLECNPSSGVCVAPSCSDGWKNGGESDVDCGGPCSTKCVLNQACRNDSDCVSGAPLCDPQTLLCSEFTCDAGQYAVGQSCVDVGVGFWSPAGDRARYACSNLPANAQYTSPRASSAQCPFLCNAGYLFNSSTGQCTANATVQYLRCNADEVAVGIYGRAGAWLDALGVRCASFNGQVVGTTVRNGGSVGGSGGDAFSYTCNPGEVLHSVTGINGWSTSSPNANWCSTTNLSSVQMVCRNVSTGATRTAQRAGGSNGNCTVASGPTFNFQCGAGQAISALVVDSANTSTYVGYMLGTGCR